MHKKEIRGILETGDLHGVNKIKEWADTAITNGTWDKERYKIETTIRRLFMYNDGALVRALADEPRFYLLVTSMIQHMYSGNLEDNAQFLKVIRDALLPHIGPEHTEDLRRKLQHAIESSYPVAVSELLNALWMKSMSPNVCDYKTIINFYPSKTALKNRNVIRAGLSQHIDAMFKQCHDFQHTNKLDKYTQSKLLEWAISANTSIDQMPILKQCFEGDLALLDDVHRKWHDERKFFSSGIADEESQNDSKSIKDSIVPRILQQMDSCACGCRKGEKLEAITWFLCEICNAIEEKNPGTKCELRVYFRLMTELICFAGLLIWSFGA